MAGYLPMSPRVWAAEVAFKNLGFLGFQRPKKPEKS